MQILKAIQTARRNRLMCGLLGHEYRYSEHVGFNATRRACGKCGKGQQWTIDSGWHDA